MKRKRTSSARASGSDERLRQGPRIRVHQTDNNNNEYDDNVHFETSTIPSVRPHEMQINTDEKDWATIDAYIKDDPSHLAQHHLDSFNYFVETEMPNMIKRNSPIVVTCKQAKGSNAPYNLCNMHMEGIRFGQPTIYEGDNGSKSTFMYPNLARLRNLTYGVPIFYNLRCEFSDDVDPAMGDSHTEQNVFLCSLPIMLKSKQCILKEMSRTMQSTCGEDPLDPGGYFIIDGAEKVLISREEDADNNIVVQWASAHASEQAKDEVVSAEANGDDPAPATSYVIKTRIRSKSDDPSILPKTLVVQLDSDLTRGVTVRLPNTKDRIPLFIVFRAMGIISDKAILEHIFLRKVEEISDHELQFFETSIYAAKYVWNQITALRFIGQFTNQSSTTSHVLQLLARFTLPHIGGYNQMFEKVLFIGHMAARLVRVYQGTEKATDREHGQYKRVATSGVLLGRLFNEHLKMFSTKLKRAIETRLNLNEAAGAVETIAYRKMDDFKQIIVASLDKVLRDRSGIGMTVHNGIMRGFKGNWGATRFTRLVGVSHALLRQTNLGFLSDLRKIEKCFPKDKEDEMKKLVAPHLMHSSMHGLFDPTNTAEDADTGLVHTLSILARITRGYPRSDLERWIQENFEETSWMELHAANQAKQLHRTKLFINGHWFGVSLAPLEHLNILKTNRRHGCISVFTSIFFNINQNAIDLWTDAGRMLRPLWYCRKAGEPFSCSRVKEMEEWNFNKMVMGPWRLEQDPSINFRTETTDPNCFYDKEISNEDENEGNVLEMIDSNELESCLFYSRQDPNLRNKHKNRATHLELHQSTIYGILTNNVIYSDHNPCVRTLIACKHNKQGISMYHSEYATRMDGHVFVLHFGQTPLVKTRYLKIANEEARPYGEHCMVAILSTVGYNVEDALCLNAGSIARGMFLTTRFKTYVFSEQMDTGSEFRKIHCVVPLMEVRGLPPNSYYDSNGLIMKGAIVTDDTQLLWTKHIVELVNPASNSNRAITQIDDCVPVRAARFEYGIVDEVYMSPGIRGTRLVKIRIREVRLPCEGDKFASRHGQKGVVGRIIPEEDMPFTASGLRPDMLMNPHAFPSRETLGQLFECVASGQSALTGFSSDGTAFSNTQQQLADYSVDLAAKFGYTSQCKEAMYSPDTGEVFPALVCLGFNFYLRLQQMVNDKINVRVGGPRDKLTRQPVVGRAAGGGASLGEMEILTLMAHGSVEVLYDATMTRSDKFDMSICDHTGAVAAVNRKEKKFYSPAADGPPTVLDEIAGKNCRLLSNSTIGKKFSRVDIPWTFRLLQMELQTAGIEMRFITESDTGGDARDRKWLRGFLANKINQSIAALTIAENDSLPHHLQFQKPQSLIDMNRLMEIAGLVTPWHAPENDQEFQTSSRVEVVNENENQHMDVVVDVQGNQTDLPYRADLQNIIFPSRNIRFVPIQQRSPFVPFTLEFRTRAPSWSSSSSFVGGDIASTEDEEEKPANESDANSSERSDSSDDDDDMQNIINSDEEEEAGGAETQKREKVRKEENKKTPATEGGKRKNEGTEAAEESKAKKPRNRSSKEAPPQQTSTDAVNEDFKIGDIVLYDNDFLETRVWKVTSIGPKFVMIETQNSDRLHPSKMIQPVTREYIRRPTDIPADPTLSTRAAAIIELDQQTAELAQRLQAAGAATAMAPAAGTFPGVVPPAPVSIRIVNQPGRLPDMDQNQEFKPSPSHFR